MALNCFASINRVKNNVFSLSLIKFLRFQIFAELYGQYSWQIPDYK